MNSEPAKHEKVQFRKRDRRDLGDFPSAQAHDAPPLKSKPAKKPAMGRALRGASYLILFFAVLAGAGYGLLRYGLEGPTLDRRAGEIIATMAGPNFVADVKGARVSLTRAGRLAISTKSLDLTNKATGLAFANAGRIDMGLALPALLTGRMEVATVEISSARLVMPPLKSKSGGDLIDPDAIIGALFTHLDVFMRAVDGPQTEAVEMADVSVDLASLGVDTPVAIKSATLRRTEEDGVQIEAAIDLGGVQSSVVLNGRKGGADTAARLDGSIKAIPFENIHDGVRDGKPVIAIRRIAGTLDLTFNASGAPGKRKLTANVVVPDLAFAIKDRVDTAGEAKINLEMAEGLGKIEILPSVLKLGRSAMVFEGAAGPDTTERAAGETYSSYRFEIVSNRAVMDPNDSPEAPVSFAGKVSGNYYPAQKRLHAREFAIRTDKGEAFGEADIVFAGKHDPAVFLALRVPRMPVAEVKQFWPATASSDARDFVLEKVSGGTAINGKIDLNVQPDRIGDALPFTSDELQITTDVTSARFDLVGDLPPIRGATGKVSVSGFDTTVEIDSGVAYLASGRVATLSDTAIILANPKTKPFFGDVVLKASGEAAAIAELISLKPIEALRLVPFGAADVSGDVSGTASFRFPISVDGEHPPITYDVALDFDGLSIPNHQVSAAKGKILVNNSRAEVDAVAELNGIPAKVKLVEPIEAGVVEATRSVTLELDDKARAKVAPGLAGVVSGPVHVDLARSGSSGDTIVADLTKAKIDLPFAGWSKSAGIPATAGFTMKKDGDAISVRDFSLKGKSFSMSGDMDLSGNGLREARFSKVQLNQSDGVAVTVTRGKGGYNVAVEGDALDVRAFIKQAKDIVAETSKKASNERVSVTANIRKLTGFNKETLHNVVVKYAGRGSRIDQLQVNAASQDGGGIVLNNTTKDGNRIVALESTDAGSVLRFLDIYPRMQGGRISVNLAAEGDGPLSGTVEARDFSVVNEPRLASLVAKPSESGSKSLSATLQKDIDTSTVSFDQGSFAIRKGNGYLLVDKGILRGNLIGTTFSGTLYDKEGAMAINGTFMPAYGINRLFGEIPLLGEILGNGSDRGLIGITYRLAGPAKNPNVLVNPVSIIAPGIFRQIFEYR